MIPRRCLVTSAFLVLAVLGLAPAASAHPLGNFSINSYSGLRVGSNAVTVHLVVDYAEIPTAQRFPDANTQRGIPRRQAHAYAAGECDRLQPKLRLRVEQTPARLTVDDSQLRFLPGQAGLRTMRLTCVLRTTTHIETLGHQVRYVDQNSLTRTGWREITATGVGVRLADSTVERHSVSDRLTDYPADLLSAPRDDRRATMQVTTGTGTSSTSAAVTARDDRSRIGALTQSFTRLVATRDLGPGFAALALLIAVGLGALHAFAPGHGKTLMAAYLLGKQSSLRHVAIIGATVTLTHTAGVLILGAVLSVVALTAPERIYGWLGIASGGLLLAIGGTLLRQARHRARQHVRPEHAGDLVTAGVHDRDHHSGRDDAHGHHHQHPHGHGVPHTHGWAGTHTHPPPATTGRSMLAVGLAGGMVPSPSALVVLLGGIALGRAWFGIVLVLGYGLGMALALIGTGLALAHARDHLEHWAVGQHLRGRTRGRLLRLTHALPAVTAGLVMLVGLGLAIRSALML